MSDGTINRLTNVAKETGGALAILAGVVSGGRALVTEASAASIRTAAESILSKLSADPSSATLQTAGNTSLATLAAVVSGGRALVTEASSAAVKTAAESILAKLSSDPSTATLQSAGNTSLATIAGVVSAGKALVTETSSAAIKTACEAVLAKLSSDPSTATLQTAGNTSLSTIAGAVGAHDAALPAGVVLEAGIGQATAPTAVTAGRAVRAWLTLTGARVAALLGKDGATIASASNGVPVSPETSSVWDVKDRAARILGQLLGADAATVASMANPIPIIGGAFDNDNQATLAAAGKLLKTGAGTAAYIFYSQTTGNSRYIQIHDSLVQPAAGARAIWSSNAITTGTSAGLALGHATFGATCKTGVYLVLSTSIFTYTATTDTALAYVALFK